MKINYVKTLDNAIFGEIVEVEGKQKIYLKWKAKPQAKGLSDSYLKYMAEEKQTAFKFHGEIIKSLKRLAFLYHNSDREDVVDSLPRRSRYGYRPLRIRTSVLIFNEIVNLILTGYVSKRWIGELDDVVALY